MTPPADHGTLTTKVSAHHPMVCIYHTLSTFLACGTAEEFRRWKSYPDFKKMLLKVLNEVYLMLMSTSFLWGMDGPFLGALRLTLATSLIRHGIVRLLQFPKELLISVLFSLVVSVVVPMILYGVRDYNFQMFVKGLNVTWCILLILLLTVIVSDFATILWAELNGHASVFGLWEFLRNSFLVALSVQVGWVIFLVKENEEGPAEQLDKIDGTGYLDVELEPFIGPTNFPADLAY